MHYFRPRANGGEVAHTYWSFASLVVGFVSMLAGGALYTFSLVGPSFHETFELTALQLNLMGAFGQIGAAAASFPAGILMDGVGPVIPLAISGCCMFLGYFLLFLLLRGSIAYDFGGLIMSYFCVGIGCQLTTIAILTANLRNFRSQWRGRILGTMGLAVGVSAAFFGLFFKLAFSQSPATFLFFLSLINLGLNALGAAVVSTPREKMSAVSWKQMIWQRKVETPENSQPLVSGARNVPEDAQSPGGGSEIASVRWEWRQLFVSVKFWLIFAMGFFGTSQGMLFMSVLLGSIHVSHGGAPGGQSVAVIVGTICSAAGRLSIGIVSDATLHVMKRVYWAFPMYALMCIGLSLCMFVDSPDSVIAAAALVGLGYGGMAGGVLPTLAADVFGTQHFAKNYSILQPAFPIGFLIWGQACGALYETEVPPGNIVCMGTHCHVSVLALMMCLIAVAVGAAVWLSFILPDVKRKPKAAVVLEMSDDLTSAGH